MAIGGWDGANALSSAEILDPLTGRWTPTAPMQTPRWGHSATVLDDGMLLIAGGVGWDDRSVSSSEIYDPATGAWTDTGDLVEARDGHVAVSLADGRVLLVGGYGADGVPISSSELFDPSTGTWSAWRGRWPSRGRRTPLPCCPTAGCSSWAARGTAFRPSRPPSCLALATLRGDRAERSATPAGATAPC